MKGKKGFQIGERICVTHDMSYTRIYKIWTNIKSRIDNKSNTRYSDYGGRGICLFGQWRDFSVFKDWAISHGYSDNLTIDRIDNDKDYCPDNCRWVTQQINSKNRRIFPMTGIRKRGNGWQVRGKNTEKCLGTFRNLELAIKIRDEYAKEQINLINQLDEIDENKTR